MWNTLGQAATVAQLVGADVGGLITMIIQAAGTVQQNKKECEQLARRVLTIFELLQHLQDPEVLRRPELRRPLAGLRDTLREAHELVTACQDRGAVYRLVLAGRQAERFRDVQSRIDSYLAVFPIISHLNITRRLDRIYNILVPNDDTAGPSTSSTAFSMPQIAVQDSHQGAPRIDSKEPYEVQEFTFTELAEATNNIDPAKKIGETWFSTIYMGLTMPVFPIISHLHLTRRLDRIYNILVPDDTAGPSTSSSTAFSMPQIAVHQDAPRIDWKGQPYEVQEFTFKELAEATNNFDPDKKIGEAAIGPIYMGLLPDGRQVAIKRLHKSSSQWMMEEYRTEVTVLSSVSHNHIVHLFGYCALQQEKRQLLPMFRKKKKENNEALIVYEYLENRSLNQHYLDRGSPSPVAASWKMRIEILLGVSRAIEYLQSYAERPVIHRDVNASNILVDASWMPRLSDFGLALTWQGPDHTEDVCGTFGYMAPEYVLKGILNLTTDVYSLGVVMLELLTGRRAVQVLIEEWVENKREASEEEEQKRDEVEGDKSEEESDEEKFAPARVLEPLTGRRAAHIFDEEREEWVENKREASEEEEQKRDECKEKVEGDKSEEESDEDKFAPTRALYRDPILVDFAVPLIEAGELWKVLDRRPAAKPTPRQREAAELVALAAVRCVQLQWEDRPSISEVVATLERALELARCDG